MFHTATQYEHLNNYLIGHVLKIAWEERVDAETPPASLLL
jgi:hypothetical protein